MPNWNEIKKEYETSSITLKSLAEKYEVKLGTLKSRKSREKWSRDATKKDATQNKKVATPKKDASEPSWIDIENEYVTDESRKPISINGLGEKYNIPYPTIRDYAIKNNWTAKREDFRRKVIEKTTEILVSDNANVKARHFQVSDKLLLAIEQALNDNAELYRYVEKLRQGYGPGEFSESIEVETLDALNESKVLNLANSLEKIQKMQRQSLGILDEKDKRKIEMDKRKMGDDEEEYEDDGFLDALDGKEVNWDEET